MSLSLYDLSVPIFVRALENLKLVLQKGEQWAKEHNIDEQKLINAKLIDDMNPLSFQIQTCCNTSKGILHRIANEPFTSIQDNETSFAEFYARIDSTIRMLQNAQREKFVSPQEEVKVKMGPVEPTFEALKYLQNFAIPNYFFHHVTAYDILRREGVPVGKVDYIGAGRVTE